MRARLNQLRTGLKQLRTDLILSLHGSGLRVETNATKEMVDQPIQPDWITAGTPRARAFCAVRSQDGSIQAGEWDCTAGSFTWTYYEDEMIRILEGAAHIEIDGQLRLFGPGDTVFFPMGRSVRWTVPEYVRKVFFIRDPSRVVKFLRNFKVLGALAVWVTSALSDLDPYAMLDSALPLLSALPTGVC